MLAATAGLSPPEESGEEDSVGNGSGAGMALTEPGVGDDEEPDLAGRAEWASGT